MTPPFLLFVFLIFTIRVYKNTNRLFAVLDKSLNKICGFYFCFVDAPGSRGSVVEALRYKPEGRGFNSR
jgi:hypothetical protein